MPSKIQVDQIAGATGSTVTLPSGQTLDLSSGTVTLPNSAVNLTTKVTGTLPVANGGTGLTTLGSASQVLRVNSGATGLEFATAPSGKVLQVVQSVKQNTASTNANSWVSTGLSASITPSNTSNKILIKISVGACGGSNTTTFRIYKDGSHLTGASGNPASTREGAAFRIIQNSNDSNHAMGSSFTYLDSPSSTSSTTYELYYKSQNGQTSAFNHAGGDSDTSDSYGSRTSSTIILMEIQA